MRSQRYKKVVQENGGTSACVRLDIKQTKKLVNEVINRKKDTVSSTEFKKDNERITDKREIVNRFNE